MRLAKPEVLASFSTDLLRAAGADVQSAEAATWALMHGSLHGIDSHGVRLLPWYTRCLAAGIAKGSPKIQISHPRRAAAMVDADGGLGHLAAYRAMDEACGLARDCGIGMASVINSTHFGAAGAYALAAADSGLIGFVTANCLALVIPHGGSKPVHGTNPIAFAAPNPGGHPFLLDMATSSIPWNSVLRFRTEELELPPGVAVDAAGAFTLDPHRTVALAPLGGGDYGYKGAGLAGLAEILGGVLTGMRLSSQQDAQAIGDTKLGQFFMAIDPTLYMPMNRFQEKLQSYLGAFAGQPGTYAAGGPEWERQGLRLSEGIPLPPGLYGELREAAAQFDVALSF